MSDKKGAGMPNFLPRDGMDDVTRRQFNSQVTKEQRRQSAILSLFRNSDSPFSCSEICRILEEREGIGGVCKRTIQRDMDLIAKKFGLAEKQKGRTKLWYRKPGAALARIIPVLDSDAAAAFLIAEQQLKQLLPASVLVGLAPWFHESHALLESSDAGEDPWYERISTVSDSFPMEPPNIDADVIEAVYQALRKKWQLKMNYRNRSGQEKVHVLNPEGLISARKTLYLAATIAGHDDITTFALHRVIKAEVQHYADAALLEKGSFQDHVDDEFLKFYVSDDELALELVFEPRAAPIMREYRLSEDQVIEELPDRSLRVTASVSDTAALRSWLLSYGALVKVVAPESLRNGIVAALNQAVLNYSN